MNGAAGKSRTPAPAPRDRFQEVSGYDREDILIRVSSQIKEAQPFLLGFLVKPDSQDIERHLMLELFGQIGPSVIFGSTKLQQTC